MSNSPTNSSRATSLQGKPVDAARSAWQEIGAWQGGTVVNVALAPVISATGEATAYGLLASRASVYQWTYGGLKETGAIKPLPQGLHDPNVVAVAYAGGEGMMAAPSFVSTATGRLYRGRYSVDDSILCGWEEINSWAGLGVAVVLTPSPAYSQDRTLFAGTPAGIFRTLDDGQSWESCNFGLLDEEILCLACAPNFDESELLWAGTAGGGFYRSRNRGRAWRESGLGLPDAAVQCLAISPNFSQDQSLYVGMEEHGVYCSHDGGENWQSIALTGVSINSLACSQAGWLWAASEDGLWRILTASGEAQQVAAAGEIVMSVAATEAGQVAFGLLGDGLWLTSDGYDNAGAIEWQQPLVALHAPPLITNVGQKLFALDSDGQMASSADGGAGWSEIEQPLTEEVFALDAMTSALFATTETGLMRWGESGWQAVAGDAFAGQIALEVSLSPSYARDHRLVVRTQEGGLFLSQDDGLTWRDISGPWGGANLLHFHFAPDAPDSAVALTVQPDNANHYNVTVWQTTNRGDTWEVFAGLSSDIPVVMMNWPSDQHEAAIFLATQHRIIKLFEAGEPPTLQVHQHFFDPSLQVTALAASPTYTEDHTIWAATTGGLFRSQDSGQTWEQLLETPQGLPVVWLEVTAAEVSSITLGGRAWRAKL